MENNIKILYKILSFDKLEPLLNFFLSKESKIITESKEIYIIEFGQEQHKLITDLGNEIKLTNNDIQIFEFEKFFSKQYYIYNSKSHINFNFIKNNNSLISVIPIISNNKLTRIILFLNTNLSEKTFALIAKTIEVSVDKITEKELFQKVNNDFQEIFSNINSLIILRDKNYNILFSNKEKKDSYKCFDVAFKFNKPCSFCPTKNNEITQNIFDKTYKIQLSHLSDKYLCIIEDISHLIKLKEELTKAEKLSFLGKISSEITHEIKNPLNSIKLKITLLNRLLSEKDQKIENIIGNIDSEIDRLSNIINDFLQFGKNVVLNKSKFNINELINEIIDNLNEETVENNIHISLKYEKALEIFADRNKLKQAFLNIIKNSIDALKFIKSNKTIDISIKSEKNNLIIKFKDSGKGIKNKENLFTPFYTTKKDGTGLGLVVTDKIIKAHNGAINYQRDNNFTVFTITIPNTESHP